MPQYNVTIEYQVYTLLEFYNNLRSELAAGIYYDEKFLRILVVGLKLKENVLKNGAYDPQENISLFITGK